MKHARMAHRLGGLAVVAALVAAFSPTPRAQSDLDALMQKVLARRDENWKKLRGYILEERDRVEVIGSSNVPIWGETREYSWFLRDGFFIQSPVKVNGVTISETERRKVEDAYLAAAQRRDQPRDPANAGDGKGGISIGPKGIKVWRGGGDPPPPAPDAPASLDALIRQNRQPEFIDAAYFFRFKFEQGAYAFVGRERLDGLEVLRVEYYPNRHFTPGANKTPGAPTRGEQMDAAWLQILNQASRVTLWIEPKANQIVKYTFENAKADGLPLAWLVRINAFTASMTMSQAFKDVWLPKDVDIALSTTMAFGPVDVRYRFEYRDYKEVTTSGRVKGRGGH